MLNGKAIQVILFDVDGTLLWSRGAGLAATRASIQEIFGTVGNIEGFKFGGKTDWLALIELLEGTGYDAEAIGRAMPSYEQVMARQLASIIDQYPVQPCPGAIELVEALYQSDSVLVGLVTGNLSSTAPIKLRAAGFDPTWFRVGAYGSESHDRNGLPALALQRAKDYLRRPVNPAQTLIVGDTLMDIACARAARAQVAAVTTGFASREELAAAAPDYLLEDLTTFMAVVMG